MTTLTGKMTMSAACIHSFGGADQVQVESLPIPEPGENQVLVQIHAAGVNPVDWKIREGKLGPASFPMVLGTDFSGVVEALGPDVEEFRVGEAVFGTVADESGSYSEFALVPVSQAVEKPPRVEHVTAAALPIPALTAWQGLFDHADLKRGQKILVHAAAGGVGGFAVQFARRKGAHVIGTASAGHLDHVRELGANEVIDYKAQKFEELVHDVDVILDTIGGETQERSWQTLRSGGILVSTVHPPSDGEKHSPTGHGVFFRCDHTRVDQLAKIAGLVADGELKVHIQTCLPLIEARRAMDLSQAGHTRGKIILKISSGR